MCAHTRLLLLPHIWAPRMLTQSKIRPQFCHLQEDVPFFWLKKPPVAERVACAPPPTSPAPTHASGLRPPSSSPCPVVSYLILEVGLPDLENKQIKAGRLVKYEFQISYKNVFSMCLC